MSNDTTYNDELPDEVDAALDIVLEEVDVVLDFILQRISTVYPKRDFACIHRLTSQAEQITSFQAKVRELEEEWGNLFPYAEPVEPVPSQPSTELRQTPAEPRRTRRKHRTHLQQGLRTPGGDFYVPILRVLVKMGGKGQASEVLSQVGEIMKPQLNEYDFEVLPSGQHDPRWFKSAQWARFYMVQDGLLSSESPRGVWEITAAGKQYLASNA
jgi:hypothetical protein